ncbi:MAG: Uma2 family endonuclease [Terriglobia bacterium]
MGVMLVDTRLTYQDLTAIPDDGKRHEIINGEHLVTAAPLKRHQLAVQNLSFALDSFVRAAHLGRVFGCPVDVVLSDYDVVEPDVIVVLKGRLSQHNERNFQGAPDIVVEVLSQSTAMRDRGDKLKLYAKHGVEEYWIVDADAQSIDAYCFHKDDPGPRTLRPADALTSCLLPGFEIRVAAIFI